MSLTLQGPVREAPVDETAEIEAVLDRLRWNVLEFGGSALPAATDRRLDGAGIRFVYLADGEIETRVGNAEPLALRAGDFMMFPLGGRVELHGVRDARLVTGSLELADAEAMSAAAMPAMLFACGFRVNEPVFASLLDAMRVEAATDRPGSSAVMARLADAVASAAVRIWLENGCGSARSWLATVRDPHLCRVVEAIHDDPGSPWTVASLARVARASRSQFAEQFKCAFGETPARYLTRVRMQRAERMLQAGAPVSEIAFRLGYESDAGFSRAFRRHAGASPSDWRRRALCQTA